MGNDSHTAIEVIYKSGSSLQLSVHNVDPMQMFLHVCCILVFCISCNLYFGGILASEYIIELELDINVSQTYTKLSKVAPYFHHNKWEKTLHI